MPFIQVTHGIIVKTGKDGIGTAGAQVIPLQIKSICCGGISGINDCRVFVGISSRDYFFLSFFQAFQ